MPANEDSEPGALGPARTALLALLVFALAWLFLDTFATRDHRDRTDEPEWVAMSILHWRQFVLGEPPAGAELDPPEERAANPWKQGVQRTVFGYMNPCLPKLFLGGVLHAAGHVRASPEVFQVFHAGRPQAGRAAREALEPALPLARRVIQTLAALCAVLLLFAGRELARGRAGWWVGGLGAALYLASPLVLHTAIYLRTDFFMLPFVLAGLLLALRARRALAGERGARAQALAGAALGLLCGLAVSSKLNGTLVCLCMALWLPLLAARRSPRSTVAALALAGTVACGVFFALDPLLWSGPLDGVRDILARWERQLEVQQARGERMGVEVARGLAQRLELFARRTAARDDPLHFHLGLPGGVLLTLGGLAVLAARAARRCAPATIALVFVLVILAGTALWLPLDWERFYLPAAPCVALLQAVALVWIGRALARRAQRTPR